MRSSGSEPSRRRVIEPPDQTPIAPHEFEALGAVTRALTDNITRAVQVRSETLHHLLVALLAEGHALVEDYPGVGKTALARAVARSIDCQFARVQCTSDLLPADVVGTNVYDGREGRFEFRPGPVFANIVLVDEINRASPKTQSGLLECMQERRVTVDVHTHELARPFLVLATQNPVEFEGTYPLPEAQVDRFMVRYIVRLLWRTREDPRVALGASPRAGLMLLRAAKANALMDGRDHALPDDVQALAEPVLAHRLVLSAETPREEASHIIRDAVRSIRAL
jgi:MoxR-like ATPase